MTRLVLALRLALAAVVATLASVGPGLGTAASARPAQDDNPLETPSEDAAIDDLVACVQGSRHLLVLFLLDESASLKNSDPEDRRVDAAQSALDSLESLAVGASGGGAGPEVDVALAAFSNEYVASRDWTTLDAETGPEVRASLDEFRDRKSGIDTDFVNALTAARETLADRAAAVSDDGGEAPCKAVLLFTDGGYDIAVRGDAAAVERLGLTKTYAPDIELTDEERVREAESLGRRTMCRAGGLADQIRGDDITLLTLALSGDVPVKLQRLLAAASAGEALGYTCGTPQERPTGAYLPASGADVLIARFDEVATRLAGGTLLPGPSTLPLCGSDACDEGTRSFDLDPSLRRAHVLSLPASSGTQVEITGPDGSATITEAGSTEIGGVQVESSVVAGRGLAIDLIRPDGGAGWDGTWTAAVLDPSGDGAGEDAVLRAYVFSDIGISLEESGVLVRGGTAEVTASIVAPEGSDAGTSIVEATATARYVDPVTRSVLSVELAGPIEGPFVGEIAVPAETTANAFTATVELRATTVSGAVVVSQAAPSEVPVRRPEGSIQFAPASLDLPALTGSGSTSTDLIIVGGKAAGCVWFGPTEVPTSPEGATPVVVTVDGAPLVDEDSCLAVPAGGQVVASLAVEPAGRASGSVAGTIELHERVEGLEETTTQLGFRFDLSRGVDQARRLALTAALFVGGLAIPLLLLLVINAVGARFQSLDAVRGAVIPVVVEGGVLRRLDRPRTARMTLLDSDFTSMAGAGSTKRFTLGGVVFRARASRNPFGATLALAAPEGGAEKLKGHEGSRIELDPALAGSWVFLLDADRTRAAAGGANGQLIAFVAVGDLGPQTLRMVPDIERRLPETAERLARLVKRAPAKPAKSTRGRRGRADGAASGDDEGQVAPSEDAASLVDASEADPVPGPVEPEQEAANPRPVADDPAPTVPAPPDDPAPAAPIGFGGRRLDAPATPAAPPGPDVSSEDDPDDPPPAAPLGFGGRPTG